MPKSQVKIGQKLKPKVKIGTWKNFWEYFFYFLINIDKGFGSNNRKNILQFLLHELKIWKKKIISNVYQRVCKVYITTILEELIQNLLLVNALLWSRP